MWHMEGNIFGIPGRQISQQFFDFSFITGLDAVRCLGSWNNNFKLVDRYGAGTEIVKSFRHENKFPRDIVWPVLFIVGFAGHLFVVVDAEGGVGNNWLINIVAADRFN